MNRYDYLQAMYSYAQEMIDVSLAAEYDAYLWKNISKETCEEIKTAAKERCDNALKELDKISIDA